MASVAAIDYAKLAEMVKSLMDNKSGQQHFPVELLEYDYEPSELDD